MSKNYEPPKTTRQPNHNTHYQPCTSQRQFYNNHISNQQQQSHRIARLNLKKSISCSTLQNDFVQTLITKMRKIPRPYTNHNKLQQVNEKLVTANLKLQKSKQKLEAYKQSFQPSQIKINVSQQKREIKKLSPETARLRNEMSELIKQNKKLSEEIKSLQCQLFYQKQKVEHLASQLESKDHIIQQLQTQFAQHQKAKQQEKQIIKGKMDLKDAQTLRIHKTINQFVLAAPSFQKISLLKANVEAMNLKKQIISLQKAHQAKYAQLNRIKNDEIEHLRKNFSATLKHYKKMIIKCTSKKNDEQNPKQSEQIMQSTLLQNSSILQI